MRKGFLRLIWRDMKAVNNIIAQRASGYKYYEPLTCSCGSREDLFYNTYNSRALCSDCLNKLVEELENEEEE